MSEQKAPQTNGAANPDAGGNVRVVWDHSKLESNYANVCNVTFTREEMVLLFGVNQSWQRQAGEVSVQLLNRLILSPFAAKRLQLLLTATLEQYEGRFGRLDLEAVSGARATDGSLPGASNGEVPAPSAAQA